MKKAEYELMGDEYLSEGAYDYKCIMRGTKANCVSAMMRMQGDGQYLNMEVIKRQQPGDDAKCFICLAVFKVAPETDRHDQYLCDECIGQA